MTKAAAAISAIALLANTVFAAARTTVFFFTSE
jgi:hypothetical protein